MTDFLKEPTFGITLDIDWAPDWMIEGCAQILIDHNVKATWFVTHDTPVLELLRAHPDLFELGIHPNFLPKSTQGSNENEIITNLVEIVPEAISMRTHRLYQSVPLLAAVANGNYGITVDVSLYLHKTSHLQPHLMPYGKSSLFRIPYFWEDDYEMSEKQPEWRLDRLEHKTPGLKIFNFHPVHICLNSISMVMYNFLLKTIGPQGITKEMGKQASKRQDEGTAQLFRELVYHLQGGGIRIKDIYESYLEDRK